MTSHTKPQQTTSKGLGLFADIDVGVGACVLTEEPLLKLPCTHDSTHAVVRQELEIQFRMLSAQDRLFVNRIAIEPPMQAKIDAWVAANVGGWHLAEAWERSIGAKVLSSAHGFRHATGYSLHVVKHLHSVNHSCEPNCRASYDPETAAWSLRALREIEKREELTVNYFKGDVRQMLMPTEQRRARIQKLRGWHCMCVRCMIAQPDLAYAREQALAVYEHDLMSLPAETDSLDAGSAVVDATSAMLVYGDQLGLPELKHKVLDWGLQWALEKELKVALRFQERLLLVMEQAYGEQHSAVRRVRALDLSKCGHR